MFKLTHANLGYDIYIYPEHIYYTYYSKANQCTHIVSIAGACVPVRESEKEVDRLITKRNKELKDERI